MFCRNHLKQWSLWVVTVTLALTAPVKSVRAVPMTGDQHKELYLHGTITESNGKKWEVIFIPGASKVTDDAAESWKDAGKMLEVLGQKDFWSDRADDFNGGFRFSKRVIVHHWILGIRDDFNEAVKDLNSLQEGDWGKNFAPIYTWTWFGLKMIGRTVWAPIGGVGGVGYAILAPAVVTAAYPVGAGLEALFPGAAVPGVLYVWNGFAWVATYFNDVPSRRTYFVKIVSYGKEGEKPKVDYVIDSQGFNAIVQASVLANLTEEKRTALQKQIDEKEAQITALRSEQRDADNALANTPAQQYLNQAMSKSWDSYTNMKLDPAAKEVVLDDTKLKALVASFLKELKVEPNDATVDAVVKQVKENLNRMKVQMAAPQLK